MFRFFAILRRMPIPRTLFIVALGCLLGPPLPRLTAQSTTAGAISGTVFDVHGRAIPAAHLSLRNQATSMTREAISGPDGNFSLPEITPGAYSLGAESEGFARWHAEPVMVEVGRLTHIDAHLTVGGPQQTIEVNGDAPRLDLITPAITANIDQTSVDGLPSNGRRWSNFALLTPGVVPDGNGFGLLSFRGISVLLNNATIDGVDNNQAFFSEERGRTRIGYSTTQASVREFQVNTSNFSAEYGRAAGGVVNTVTRTGGSSLHGQAFFYDRDNVLGATNAFTTLTQRTPLGDFVTTPYRAQDSRKQWGIGLGGPVPRTRQVFWFFAYDQYRRNFPGVARAGHPATLFAPPSVSNIQSLAARMGTSPVAALGLYNGALNSLAGLLGPVPRSANQTIFFPKIDWQMNERNHLTLQYNRMRWSSPGGVQTQASDTYGVASFGNDYTKEDWVIARWELFLTANMLNEAHYQYGRDFEAEFSQLPTTFEQPFAQNVYQRAPQINLSSGSNGFTFGKPSFLDRAAYPDERRQQFVDTVTWVHRGHSVKAGYDLNNVDEYSNNLYNGTGTYSYSNTFDFVSDLLAPSRCAPGGGVGSSPCYTYFTQSTGPSIFQFNTADYALFLTDEWNLRHGLTLSAGARYEYEQLPNPNRNLVNPDIPQTASLPHDGNNFGPRLGLAWDVFGTGHTVLRAGYGMYFGRIINSTAFSGLTNTGSPNAQRSYFFRPFDVGAPPFPYVFGLHPVVSVAPDAVYFASHFQNPQVHQTEVSLEQALPRDTELTLSYLGSYGRELPNFVDHNIDLASASTITYQVYDSSGKGPLHGTYTVPFYTKRLNPNYQQITEISSETNSRYQAGVARLNHRMRRLLDLHLSYTYAHAVDFNQNQSTFNAGNNILDPANFALEYGNSNYDIRHRGVVTAIARTPWRASGRRGWLVNGYAFAPVAELRSGQPYTMRTTGSVPYLKYLDSVNRIEYLKGIGPGINGSGGDNRIPAVGRNTFRYPAVYNFDMRASKRTPINERCNLEVMAEAFNLFNHQNVTSIDTYGYILDGASAAGDPARLTYRGGSKNSFGSVTNSNSNTLYRERQIQLALRLTF